VKSVTLSLKSASKRQVIDITELVNKELSGQGLVNLLLKHTTAALALADLDPGTDQDYLEAIKGMTPDGAWRHPHQPEHFPDHLWSTLIGQSLSLPFRDGRLDLGSWQSLVVIELAGPRLRQLVLLVVSYLLANRLRGHSFLVLTAAIVIE